MPAPPGRYELRLRSRRLLIDGIEAPIGGRAFDLLMALIARRDRVVGTAELVELVWPDVAVEPNNLQVQIWALRKLLGHQTITTVPRRGYQFTGLIASSADAVTTPRHLGSPEDSADEPMIIVRLDTAPDPDEAGVQTRVLAHRLVTLIGAEREARRALALAASSGLRRQLEGGVWWTQAATLPDWLANRSTTLSGGPNPGRPGPSIERLTRRPTLLVVFDCDPSQSAHREALSEAMRRSAQVRLLATSERALGLPDESIVLMPSWLPAKDTPAAPPSPPSAPSGLRWRSRSA